ncbi:MAG: spore germination protein GerPB [Bacillus sp. (in: firmicutes)]
MNYHVTQSIHIHSIKINTITNSSIFQIGSTGIIKSLAPNASQKGPASNPNQATSRRFQISRPSNQYGF